jgi:hypothetical protein
VDGEVLSGLAPRETTMKAKMLGVLGLGFGGGVAVAMSLMASGCFLPWMAAARADDSYSYTCTGADHEVAQWDIGTDDPAEQARVIAVTTYTKPHQTTGAWYPPQTANVNIPYWNGSTAFVVTGCGEAGAVVTFVRR